MKSFVVWTSANLVRRPDTYCFKEPPRSKEKWSRRWARAGTISSAFAGFGFALVAAAAPVPARAAYSVASPRFTVIPQHGNIHPGVHPATPLQTWSGTINYNGTNYSFTMVGTDPATTNVTTTITVYVIPIKMVYGKNNGNMTFDPNVDQANGTSITQNVLNSPLFNSIDWSWGPTDVGTTQYVDAYQRGNFWQDVTTNTSYHVVLAPSVLAEQTIDVTRSQGKVIANPSGPGVVGTMKIAEFDPQLQTFMSQFPQINPTVLVLFLTNDVYLMRNSCCIGGYHSADTNGQTYAYATYATSPGAFSQDISGLSHEIGEWYDDPAVTSNSPCGILENGDPLENLANRGDFPVVYNSVTWHPQALAFMEYFGEPANFSANNWLDNQQLLSTVCQNGP